MTEKYTNMLPKTFKSMKGWDGQDLPSEEVFEAFYLDMKLLIEERREGKLFNTNEFYKKWI
jgi:putative spermidine/putrescine transport system permease protein